MNIFEVTSKLRIQGMIAAQLHSVFSLFLRFCRQIAAAD